MDVNRLSGWMLMSAVRSLGGALTASVLLGMTVASASAQDAERGHQIAERWCSACHAVDKKGANRTEVPSFMSIAAKHHNDQKWLRAWLMAPHPSMPDMSLSRIEIDDVVAYLKALSAS